MIQRALGLLLFGAALAIPMQVSAALVTVTVPEPASMLLLATGIAGIGGAVWRRRR